MTTITVHGNPSDLDPKALSVALKGLAQGQAVEIMGAIQKAGFLKQLATALAGFEERISLQPLDGKKVRIHGARSTSTVRTDSDVAHKAPVVVQFSQYAAAPVRLTKAERTYLSWLTKPMPKEKDRPRDKDWQTTDDRYYGVYISGRHAACFDNHNLHVGPVPARLEGMSGLVIPTFTADRFEVQQSEAEPAAFAKPRDQVPGRDALTIRWRAGTLRAALHGLAYAAMEVNGEVYPLQAEKITDAIGLAADRDIVTMRIGEKPNRFYMVGKSWAALCMGVGQINELTNVEPSVIDGDVDQPVTIRSTTGDHERHVTYNPLGVPFQYAYNWSLT